jgi:hypothetical protein
MSSCFSQSSTKQQSTNGKTCPRAQLWTRKQLKVHSLSIVLDTSNNLQGSHHLMNKHSLGGGARPWRLERQHRYSYVSIGSITGDSAVERVTKLCDSIKIRVVYKTKAGQSSTLDRIVVAASDDIKASGACFTLSMSFPFSQRQRVRDTGDQALQKPMPSLQFRTVFHCRRTIRTEA